MALYRLRCHYASHGVQENRPVCSKSDVVQKIQSEATEKIKSLREVKNATGTEEHGVTLPRKHPSVRIVRPNEPSPEEGPRWVWPERYAPVRGVTDACSKVDFNMRGATADTRCRHFLRSRVTAPNCSGRPEMVPRVLHMTGKGPTPNFAMGINIKANPSFFPAYRDDAAMRTYVEQHCGQEAALALDCFVAPAFRADLFRHCALKTHGGVYVDGDLILTVPLERAISMCNGATIGQDPARGGFLKGKMSSTLRHINGKQMKILAAGRGHPLFVCMVREIIAHVKQRYVTPYSLNYTGPALLEHCYQSLGGDESALDVAVTYRDSRNAKWPYGGMIGTDGMIAFEQPNRYDYQELVDETARARGGHYDALVKAGVVYSPTCKLRASAEARGPPP